MTFLDPKDARIAECEAQLATRDALIVELRAKVAKLTARVAELEAKLGRNSGNSSKPPSSDGPEVQRKPKEPTGRRRGGQPGHEGHTRELLPIEQVDRIVPLVPTQCRRCSQPLHGEDASPLRHQVTEVPPIRPVVTEYQCHELRCEACGCATRAQLPPGVPEGAFGPRLMSMVAVCTGKYRMPKRVTQELLSDFLGTELALGSVSRVEQQVSQALAVPVEQARAFVREQPVVHQDETGWREDKHRVWLWVAVTPLVTVFELARSRGGEVSRRMLGEGVSGTLVSDRWSAYAWVHRLRRQVCWAHLLREFAGFAERGGVLAACGQSLLDEMGIAFEWWHRFTEGAMERRTFQRKMLPLMREVGRLLREASACGEKGAGTCREILKLEDSLWTFVYVAGVEPTNNPAERALRPAVIWRKGSFGTDSADGSRFVERILTVVATLKSQGRHVLDYLTAACESMLLGQATPSLLPEAIPALNSS
jgi:transposase